MNGLKKIILGIIIFFPTFALAQTQYYLVDNPDNKASFGVRAGLDISSAANGGATYSNSPGFNVGVTYNVPVYKNLYLEPGVNMFYNTFGTSFWVPVYKFDEETNNEEIDYQYQIDGSLRNFGFRIPLMIGYHFDFSEDVKIHLFTGPQLNLNVCARYHQNEVKVPGYESAASSESIFGTGGFKHLDLQWKVGVGLSYRNYYMDISGAWGITRLKDATSMTTHGETLSYPNINRNLFTIELGYNF